MPFIVIKGKFVPKAGIPDGDSVRFKANNRNNWYKLKGKKVEINEENFTVQLRFEGIDSIEKSAIKPLSSNSTKNMLKLIKYNKNNNPTPNGYILARETDNIKGRPICFVFSGSTNLRDGKEEFLNSNQLKDSINYKQMQDGYAYPLYYNTLFADLRNELTRGYEYAVSKNLGYWPTDKTTKGVTINDYNDLKIIPPIWPKLWRRLKNYIQNNNSLDDFIRYLEKQNERIDILTIMDEKGLQDIVKVEGNKVKMIEEPKNIRVVGKSGNRNR